MNRFTRKALQSLRLYNPVIDLKHWLQGTQKKYQEFYSQFVSEGDLCFDVGANVGRRTSVLLFLKTRVVAVEPQPHCMEILKKKFAQNGNVTLVNTALSDHKGTATMYVSNTHSLSSLSKEWIRAVQDSGRYTSSQWDKTITVPLETLDTLIEKYGRPVFLKIDVEGHERDVIAGLSTPIRNISFEFTPEYLGSTMECVENLARLGNPEFNLCLGETPFHWHLEQWENAGDFRRILETIAAGGQVGDVYVRFDL